MAPSRREGVISSPFLSCCFREVRSLTFWSKSSTGTQHNTPKCPASSHNTLCSVKRCCGPVLAAQGLAGTLPACWQRTWHRHKALERWRGEQGGSLLPLRALGPLGKCFCAQARLTPRNERRGSTEPSPGAAPPPPALTGAGEDVGVLLVGAQQAHELGGLRVVQREQADVVLGDKKGSAPAAPLWGP